MELWSYDQEGKTILSRVLGGSLYVGARVLGGSPYVGAIDALNPESGTPLWQYQPDEEVLLDSLFITNDVALVMNKGGLMAWRPLNSR